MITDEVMELLDMMVKKLEGTAYAQGIDAVIEALSNFDECEWANMSNTEKSDFVISAIKNHISKA